MFLDSWSIALLICGIVVLFMMGFAARSAARVLIYWDPKSDSNRQIRLENEIWLTSTLIEYALAVHMGSQEGDPVRFPLSAANPVLCDVSLHYFPELEGHVVLGVVSLKPGNRGVLHE